MQQIYDALSDKTDDELLVLYYEMQNNNIILKTKYDLVIYDLYNKNMETHMANKVERPNQQSFREKLIERYGCCIITGSDNIVCEACHIMPFAVCSESDKYNINNGLLLRNDLHNLFDKKLIYITSDMHLRISDVLQNITNWMVLN